MTQKVVFRKGENKFQVHFMYNIDIIDIMKTHHGWWYRKEKCWQFPLSKFDDVYDDIKANLYSTKIVALEKKHDRIIKEPKTQTSLDYWKDPDTVSVAGHCKECGLWHFLNKSGICLQCSMKAEKE